MLSTDLVPVHNDIWRKLPFSSWRDFKPYREPSLWRRQKGHRGCDLNTDPEVFLYLPASSFEVVNLRCFPTRRLHFTGPTLWILIRACPEHWSGIEVLEAWASARLRFLHEEGSKNPRVFLDADTGGGGGGFHLFDQSPPLWWNWGTPQP